MFNDNKKPHPKRDRAKKKPNTMNTNNFLYLNAYLPKFLLVYSLVNAYLIASMK